MPTEERGGRQVLAGQFGEKGRGGVQRQRVGVAEGFGLGHKEKGPKYSSSQPRGDGEYPEEKG